MSALTAAKIRNVNVFVDTQVQKARRDTPTTWQKVAVKKTQAVGKGLYAAMNDVPPVSRKGTAGYNFAKPASYVYELKSERVGTGLEMDADDVADDVFGVYEDKINLLGARIEQFPEFGVYELLKEGDQTTLDDRSIVWVDGLAFFHDSHKVNLYDTTKGTFDNLLTGTALSAANFVTAYAALMKMKDTEGKRMGLRPNRLIVPPDLFKTAADILYAVTVSTGGQNTLSNALLKAQGMPEVEIVVAADLADDSGIWYLAAVSDTAAPVVFQETEALKVIPKIDPTDDNVYHDDKLLWLAKGRAQFGWGDARRIIRCEA